MKMLITKHQRKNITGSEEVPLLFSFSFEDSFFVGEVNFLQNTHTQVKVAHIISEPKIIQIHI